MFLPVRLRITESGIGNRTKGGAVDRVGAVDPEHAASSHLLQYNILETGGVQCHQETPIAICVTIAIGRSVVLPSFQICDLAHLRVPWSLR